ncbi:MAG: porin [Bacteroidales bacterium]
MKRIITRADFVNRQYSFKKSTLIIFCILLSLTAVPAQDEVSADEKLKSYLHRDFFKLNILMQSGARFSFRDDNFQGGRTFELANARISLRGGLNKGFFYRININAVSDPVLLDAFVGYRLNKYVSVAAGAMKPTQTLDYMPEPGSTDFIDRTKMTGLLVSSREIGVSASGDIGDFYYYAGIFNGTRLQRNNNNKMYGIGRLQYTIRDLIPASMQLGLSASHGNSPGVRSGSSGPFLEGTRTIWGADLRVESGKMILASEYLAGHLQVVGMAGEKELISGYYFTYGYVVSESLMVLGRWQTWSYREADTRESQLTLGTNITVTELVSFRFNIDAYIPANAGNSYGASAVFQVQF